MKTMKTMSGIVEKYQLVELPGEGGYYRETDRHQRVAEYDQGERNLSTSIYFLMTREKFSAWHKLTVREEWSFHEGVDIKLHTINTDGQYNSIIIGASDTAVHKAVIEPGTWFAAEIIPQPDAPEECNFALVTCVCVPGFEFEDLELGNRDILLREHGASSTECFGAIMRLTRGEKVEHKQVVSVAELASRSGSPVHTSIAADTAAVTPAQVEPQRHERPTL